MDDSQTSLQHRRPRWRRAAAWPLLVALVLSLAMHGTVLKLIDGARRPGGAGEQDKVVEVALVVPAPAAAPAPPAVAAPRREATPAPVSGRPAPRPRPRPRPAPVPVAAPPASIAESLPAAPVVNAPVVTDPALSADAGSDAQAGSDADGDAATALDGAASDGKAGRRGRPRAQPIPEPQAASSSTDETPAEPPVQAAACTPAPTQPLFGQALADPPPSGRWMYDIYFGEYSEQRQIAELELTLQRDNDGYRLASAGRARGLTALLYSGELRQLSVGRFGANGLEPQRYAEQRGKREERYWQTDPSQCEVVFGGQARAASQPGEQDRLSVLVQLGMLARSQPDRFEAGRQVETVEVSLGAIDHVRYLSHGQSVLETPDGPLRTLQLQRLREPGEQGPSIDIWLGYDVAMLPVRIRVTESNGRVLDQLMRRGG